MLVSLALFFDLDFSLADPVMPIAFLAVGSLSFIGIRMMAAILPPMHVERGARMTFVRQGLLYATPVSELLHLLWALFGVAERYAKRTSHLKSVG